MIIYAVELELAVALQGEYLVWLRDHVQAMLALPGFLSAEILRRTDPAPPAGCVVFVVRYRLRDRAAWDGYLAGPAARMRAAGIARFGDRVHAARYVLEAP